MMMKGPSSCILTISGDNPASVNIEWLHGQTDEPIRLFRNEEESCLLQNSTADFPADAIVAAAIGKNLHTKGQFFSFNWEKAKEFLRIRECSLYKPPIIKSISEEIRTEPVEKDIPAIAQPKEYIPAKCPCKTTPTPITVRPFPQKFPESEWIRHDYPSPGGGWHYLTGTIYREGTAVASATAVPGKYNIRPPAWLKEFSLFLNCAETHQGYWIALTPFSVNSIKTEET